MTTRLIGSCPPPPARRGSWAPPNLRRLAPLLLLGLAVVAGCADEGQISVYEVSREEVPQTDTTLGAMLPLGDEAWFFKLSGPREQVEPLRPAFDQFIQSLRVPPAAGGTPQWTLPAGWKELPGDNLRFATLRVGGGEPPLDLSVTRLPFRSGNEDEYLLANINRWRGQLSLPRVSRSQLPDVTQRVALAGGTATVVELHGSLKASVADAGSLGMPPRAGTGDPAAGASAELAHRTPEGWTRSAGNSLTSLAYEVREGGKRVEITLTRLGPAAAQLLPNVNRWRGQIQLPPTTEEELAASLQKIPAGDSQADYVELLGPPQGEQQSAIYAAIAVTADAAWFFKMMGDAGLAAREKQHFLDFVESIQF